MIQPDIKDLMDKMDSRYTLVVATAKRARQLVDGDSKMTKFNSDKAVTLAIHEIAENRIAYSRDAEHSLASELEPKPEKEFKLDAVPEQEPEKDIKESE